MKIKNQIIAHYGSGNINNGCQVYENRYYQNAYSLQELKNLLLKVQRLIPVGFNQEQQKAILDTLDEIEKSIKQNNKTKLPTILQRLRTFSSNAVATATFAAAITELITFFSK